VIGGPAVAGAHLPLPLLPGAGRRRWRRPLGLGLALLGLGGLGALLAAGATDWLSDGPAAGSASPHAALGPGQGAAALAAPPSRQPVASPGPEARLAAERVVAPTHAAALFAPHSWYVAPPRRPPPPPAQPPPPPEPTAPAFPYAFVGSYSPEGSPPVFFLSRGDRVIDAHVGDRLDGVYQLESAADGQLVFVYLPLNVRHHLAAGASR